MTEVSDEVVILGAGLAGCSAALNLANNGIKVSLFDRSHFPINAASLHNEGKLHLGYVYAMDSEQKTHHKMIEGSLQFAGIIEHLTGIDQSSFSKSSPFYYCVPRDSMLSAEKTLEHFNTVDQDINKYLLTNSEYFTSKDHKPVRRLSDQEAQQWFDLEYIDSVIETHEFAVDPLQVANHVSAALLANENIRFNGNCEIDQVEFDPSGAIQLFYRKGNKRLNEKFHLGINCLWEDRLRIDKSLGIIPRRNNITRFKSTITLYDTADQLSIIPSTTFVVGAYGDIVNYKNGQYYFSWYPQCKLAETVEDDLDQMKSQFLNINKNELIKESLKELSRYIPEIRLFEDILSKGKVGGGFICGWGKTDITDYDSGLHARNEIGVEEHGQWLSINTGKYCTAPLFGMEASNKILELV